MTYRELKLRPILFIRPAKEEAMTTRDPDDAYQLAKEELADQHDREAKRIVDAAREISPDLAAAIDPINPAVPS